MAPSTPETDAADSATPRVGGTAHVYHELREDILALRLRPGQELDEAALAERFGRAHTTVREALLNLSSERLVELMPNRGARVAQLDFIELPRFIEAIDLVSRAINLYAAERRSDADLATIESAARLFEAEIEQGDPSTLTARNRAFHMAVAAAADSSYLYAAYRRLFDEGMRMMHLALGRARTAPDSQGEHLRHVAGEHDQLVEAIRARDGARAEAMARAHTELFRRRVFQYLDTDSGDSIDVSPLTG